MSGWIKLHRSIRRWEWWSDVNTRLVFLELIMSANHKPSRWKGIEIGRGQLVTGRKKLAQNVGISERAIRTSLKRLQMTNEVAIETTSRYSIITVVNYDTYQDKPGQATSETTSETTSKRPASDQQVTTNKNDQELLKNEEEDKKPPLPPLGETPKNDPKPNPTPISQAKAVQAVFDSRSGPWLGIAATEALETWIKYRRELKRPLTATGVKTILKKYALDTSGFIGAVEHSISKGYQGLFDPDNRQRAGPRDPNAAAKANLALVAKFAGGEQ